MIKINIKHWIKINSAVLINMQISQYKLKYIMCYYPLIGVVMPSEV